MIQEPDFEAVTDSPPTSAAVWPHSPANEEAFLGAAIIDPEALREINLQPDDFYIRRNQWVYEAILDLQRGGQAVDYITVCTALDTRGRLTEIGGPTRLIGLINNCASSINIDSYAETIREKARRRRVLKISQKLTGAAFAENGKLEAAISEALESLSRAVVKDKGALHISHYLGMVWDEVTAAIENPQEIYGITTGLKDWDLITGGLQRGEVVKLSGEPGLGKSLLAMQILCSAAEAGNAGALYELEMSGKQTTRRSVSSYSKITTDAMRSGKITPEQMGQFDAAIAKLEKLPVYISDSSVMTTMDIRADLQRLKDNYGVVTAVIDYEALLEDDPDKDDNARSKLISKRVHDIAKDLDIAIISIMDMTKEGIRTKAGGQAAMAGTARSLHDADQIVIMRKVEETENKVRLTWEKMREGGADRFLDLIKIPGFPTFGPAVIPARK
jgi:replicative DNA helicase